MTPEQFDVSIDRDASDEEIEAVKAAFREAGFGAEVQASYGRKALETLPWIVFITAPITAFLTGFAAAAGKDAWEAVKAFVVKIKAARGGGKGEIVVRAPNGANLVIGDDLPDEAFVGLAELNLDDYPDNAYFVWHDKRREWRDATPGR
jgi:hypothetical protein